MTKKEILEMTGLSEEEFYQQYPTEESWTESYKKGGWIQKATASIKRRGTEGKCTPMSKPGCTGRALALAKTFHKMAAKRKKKEEGGYVDMYEEGGKIPDNVLRSRLESHMSPAEAQDYINSYEQGGMVDVYQLMGMPTPEMYEPGGKVRRRYKSPDRTDDNLSVIRSKSTDNLNLPDEYAASYDSNSLNLGIVDAKRYNRALGLDYNKSFGPFTAGIRGGVNKETTPTLYQKKGTKYEKVKEGEAKNILFGGLYGRVGTSIAPDLDTNTEVISFNPSLEVGLDKYGNSTKPYYDASVDVGFLNNMGSIGGGYTNRRQPYAVSLPSEGTGQESYPYAGASLNVPIVRDREGNPRLTVAGGYNIPLSKNTPDSGYAGLTYGFGKGGMIKRKDGSYSRRGLWDNIRANRGSGKKPTAEMLKQEKKIRAAEKKEYGGMVNMYGMGGTTNIGDLSHVISAKNFPNMGYAMGGYVPMYGFGSIVKDIGAGLYGAGEGMLDTLSMGATDALTDKGYATLQDLGGSSEAEKRQQDSIRGYGTTAGAITMGILNPLTASSAVRTGAKGLGQGISKGSPDSQLAQSMGTLLPMAGNAAGMVGGQMSIPSVPQAAMGGPVNYPEGYQKNITFAMGGMPEEETMPLKDKYNQWLKAKPTTKYFSGGMTPHPEIGIDPSGTVPTKSGDINVEGGESMWNVGNSQFIGTKAKTKGMLKDYNNRDLIALASKFNTIERDKAKNEAKDAQIAMAEEQKAAKAMNRITAKYGGAIKRMYAKGGMVPMYNGGSTVLNTSAPSNYWSWANFQPVLPLDNPGVYASLPEFMGTSTIPGSSFGSTPTNPFDISLPLQPMQPRGIDPSSVMTARPTASPQGVYTGPGSRYYTGMPAQTFDASNITGFDPGQYPNRVPYKVEAGEAWPGTAASKTAGSPGAGGDMSDFGKYAETAAMLGPGLYNLGMGLFSKPEKFDKLKLSGQLKSYETPYQTDYAPYYATKYALRQAGQSSPAALSQLFATFSKQEAANRLANREQNLRRQMAADQFNLSRADQVAQTNLGIDQLNAQQRAARRNMIGEGISNIGLVAAYNKGMRQDKDVLGDLYKNYEFKDGKWVYKV